MNVTPLLPTTILLACVTLLAAGCKPDGTPGGSGRGANPAESGSPQTGLPTTTMTIGKQQFNLEVASTAKAREVGLMYRDAMPADHGMIFVFKGERTLPFWMKHTRLPLDILYVDHAGKIVSIHQMQPFDLTGATSRGPAQYAIELNQGAAAAAGVKDGDQLQLPADVTSLTAE